MEAGTQRLGGTWEAHSRKPMHVAGTTRVLDRTMVDCSGSRKQGSSRSTTKSAQQTVLLD